MQDDWTEERSIALIRAFRVRPQLWDSKHPFYFRRKRKADAWAEIGMIMNAKPEVCKHKMEILMSSFRREKCKMQIRNSSDNCETTYTTNWFGYKEMSFMLDKDGERIKQRSMVYIDLTASDLTHLMISNEDAAYGMERIYAEKVHSGSYILHFLWKWEMTNELLRHLLLSGHHSIATDKQKGRECVGLRWNSSSEGVPLFDDLDEINLFGGPLTPDNNLAMQILPMTSSVSSSASKVKRRKAPATPTSTTVEAAASESTSNDEILSFTNFIASKMKRYSEVTKNAVQQRICEIIFKADQRQYETPDFEEVANSIINSPATTTSIMDPDGNQTIIKAEEELI